jgi:amino acid transporter
VYFTTCGGAFGIEPLISAVGPGWAVLLILVMPVIWSLPLALMVAELATRMPEEGGYYIWVGRTLGRFWGVQEAWWTMGYSVALMAIFPVLFVSYLTFLGPSLGPAADAAYPGWGALIRWLAATAVIVTATGVNLRGAREVGRSAKFGALFVLGAFLLLVLVWASKGTSATPVVHLVRRDLASNHPGALLLGLSIIVFNYSGWDNVSTFAEEVDEPQRNYPRAVLGALLVVALTYLLPVVAGLSVTTDPSVWSAETGWPVIAQSIGGVWLGVVIAIAGLVSMWELFNAQLLYVSRLPFVLARDGWLPTALARISPDTAVPDRVILGFGALAVAFAALPFGSLAVIQGVLYTAALVLEILALITVRARNVESHGSFRVPGGIPGLYAVCIAPLLVAAAVVVATLRDWRSYPVQLLVVVGIVVSGVLLFVLRRNSGTLSPAREPAPSIREITTESQPIEDP